MIFIAFRKLSVQNYLFQWCFLFFFSKFKFYIVLMFSEFMAQNQWMNRKWKSVNSKTWQPVLNWGTCMGKALLAELFTCDHQYTWRCRGRLGKTHGEKRGRLGKTRLTAIRSLAMIVHHDDGLDKILPRSCQVLGKLYPCILANLPYSVRLGALKKCFFCQFCWFLEASHRETSILWGENSSQLICYLIRLASHSINFSLTLSLRSVWVII